MEKVTTRYRVEHRIAGPRVLVETLSDYFANNFCAIGLFLRNFMSDSLKAFITILPIYPYCKGNVGRK